MLSETILKGDWSEYNLKKTRHIDRLLFNCDEDWEIDYLIDKIRQYGSWPELKIRQAINLACYEELQPRPRGSFIRCVVKMLD
jgi:hypothetical protein